MKKNTITFEFDDEKDLKEILLALSKKTNILWDNDKKEAMMTTFIKKRLVVVSKSIEKLYHPIIRL